MISHQNACVRAESFAESDDTDTVKENLNVSSVGIKCPSSCSADNKALERSLAENQGDADSPPMSPVDSTISERTKEESDKLQKNYTVSDVHQILNHLTDSFQNV